MKLENFFKILSYEEVVLFGKAQKNRKLDEKHVNDFVTLLKDKQFVPDEDGDMLAYGIIPIIVNPITNHLMDGQHKTEAFKRAVDRGLIPSNVKILVGFWEIEDEAHENEVTIMLNSKSKNWGVADYLHAYAQDKATYSRLEEFCKTHSLCNKVKTDGTLTLNYRYGSAIITGKGCCSALKQGTLSYTDEQYELADKIHDEMVAIRNKLNMKRSSEVEDMAKEWHKQRKLMSAADIVALDYIPKGVADRQILNQGDWREVFSILDNRIKQNKLKKEGAL